MASEFLGAVRGVVGWIFAGDFFLVGNASQICKLLLDQLFYSPLIIGCSCLEFEYLPI